MAVGIVRRIFWLFVLGGKELDFGCGKLQTGSGLIGAFVDICRGRSCSSHGDFATFCKVFYASICCFTEGRYLDVSGLGCIAPTFVDSYGECAEVFICFGCAKFRIGSKVADDRPVIYNSHPFMVFGVEMEWVTGVEPAKASAWKADVLPLNYTHEPGTVKPYI